MEEVRVDDYRINVVDDFMLPNELVELRKDLKHFDWNAFETDIYKQQRVLSGMIADLSDKWRNMLDDRIISQAKALVDKEYSIFRAYLNAWKCDDVSLLTMMVITQHV